MFNLFHFIYADYLGICPPTHTHNHHSAPWDLPRPTAQGTFQKLEYRPWCKGKNTKCLHRQNMCTNSSHISVNALTMQTSHWLCRSLSGTPTILLCPFLSTYLRTSPTLAPGKDCSALRVMCPPVTDQNQAAPANIFDTQSIISCTYSTLTCTWQNHLLSRFLEVVLGHCSKGDAFLLYFHWKLPSKKSQ